MDGSQGDNRVDSDKEVGRGSPERRNSMYRSLEAPVLSGFRGSGELLGAPGVSASDTTL